MAGLFLEDAKSYATLGGTLHAAAWRQLFSATPRVPQPW